MPFLMLKTQKLVKTLNIASQASKSHERRFHATSPAFRAERCLEMGRAHLALRTFA